jgi:hypothetical protein
MLLQSLEFALEAPSHAAPGHVHRSDGGAGRTRCFCDGQSLQHVQVEEPKLPGVY